MARDPNRIPEILAAVKVLWQLSPDQRFGQLISNIVNTGKDMKTKDIRQIEDNEMLKAIEEFMIRYHSKGG